jgi:hypothetical protein
MWLFTKHGFFSVTQADRADRIQIRARTDRHLRNLQAALPELDRSPIIETPAADYRWRMVVARWRWELVAKHLTDEIDYRNYKSKVGSHGTATDMIGELHEVWGTMHAFQTRKHRPDPLAGHPELFRQREALFEETGPDDDASAGWSSYAGRGHREEPPEDPYDDGEEAPLACDFCGTTSGDVGSVTLGTERFNCCPHCWDGDPENPPSHPRAQAAGTAAALQADADAESLPARLAAAEANRTAANLASAINADPEPNPWKTETWNLTEQSRILKSDRQRAQELAKAAGIDFSPKHKSPEELRRERINRQQRERRARAREAKEAAATKERISNALAKQNKRAKRAAAKVEAAIAKQAELAATQTVERDAARKAATPAPEPATDPEAAVAGRKRGNPRKKCGTRSTSNADATFPIDNPP